MKLYLFALGLIAAASPAFAQAAPHAPTAAQFQYYRQDMANKVANMADAEAICETSAATLSQNIQQFSTQLADAKKQIATLTDELAKAKAPAANPKLPATPPSP